MTEREIINDVINDIKWVIENGYIANDYGLKDIEESLKKAIKISGNREKYAWHDLRKDPKDLPKGGCEVLGRIINGNYRYYMTCEYICGAFCPDSDCASNNVVAWKYIEPFEEDSE